tara:strand:- start:88 stop:297 length:210 start_codon:yes stop_codon:yes gene_type:complete
MKNNIKMITIIIVGIIALYFFSIYSGEYNLKRTIQACVMGQKKLNESFEFEKAQKFCEDKIRKKTTLKK